MQIRNLQVTPPHTPTYRSSFGERGKQIEEHDSDIDDRGSSADTCPIRLVTVRDDSEGDDLGKVDTESTENEFSPRLLPSSED